MVLLAVTAIGLVGAVVDHKFSTADAICFVGVDDKSAANLPSAPHEHTSTLERMIVSLNGQADYIDQTMTAMLVDSAKSMKNTDVGLNEILINLLERLNGEKVQVRVGGARSAEFARGRSGPRLPVRLVPQRVARRGAVQVHEITVQAQARV
jgi:hypothetical protein